MTIVENPVIDIEKKLKKDLEYIKNDILAKQFEEDSKAPNDEKEKFIKFSRQLNAFTVIDLTKRQYKKYWNTQYTNYPDKIEEIFEAIDDKFNNGLTSTEEMIEIIKNSKDNENEKKKAIDLLTKPKEKKYVGPKKGGKTKCII